MLINKQNFHNLKFQFPFAEHAVNKNSKRSEMYLLVFVIVGVLKQGGTECIKLKRKKKVNPDGFGFQRKTTEQKLARSFFVNHRKRRKEI